MSTVCGGAGEPCVDVDLTGIARVIVIAIGKGAATMLQGLLTQVRLPPSCKLSGILVAPTRPAELRDGMEYFAGGHPLPNAESFAGARAARSLIQQAAAQAVEVPTFCFFLISGGASAMLELPLDDTIPLEDTVAFHRALVHSGASIAEINCVRKHFSAVKGGRLGQAAVAIPNLSIMISDVPSGHLDSLASGPTLPDRSTLTECREVLRRFDLLPQLPASVTSFFNSPTLLETPKPGSYTPRIVTFLSSRDLAESARIVADTLKFNTVIDESCDDWDYRPAAQHLLARLRDLRSEYSKVCIIVPGEVTVTLPKEITNYRSTGVGGRNQHFALYTATLLQASDRPAVVFSAGSDGIDGDSSFAGAVIDYDSVHYQDQFGLAQEALLRFDSSTFLSRIGATIKTGPTGNNLRDLRLLLVD
jgi:hydroxypyruvate reductase